MTIWKKLRNFWERTIARKSSHVSSEKQNYSGRKVSKWIKAHIKKHPRARDGEVAWGAHAESQGMGQKEFSLIRNEKTGNLTQGQIDNLARIFGWEDGFKNSFILASWYKKRRVWLLALCGVSAAIILAVTVWMKSDMSPQSGTAIVVAAHGTWPYVAEEISGTSHRDAQICVADNSMKSWLAERNALFTGHRPVLCPQGMCIISEPPVRVTILENEKIYNLEGRAYRYGVVEEGRCAGRVGYIPDALYRREY